MTAKLAEALGYYRGPEESEADFLRRVEISLQLVVPRPVTLHHYCNYAVVYAGRGSSVTGEESGERIVNLLVHLPRYRRLTRWQRRRVKRRVWSKVNEIREVNFIVNVQIAQ